MTALSGPRLHGEVASPELYVTDVPVGLATATTLYPGGLVGLNSGGYLVPASTAVAGAVLGVLCPSIGQPVANTGSNGAVTTAQIRIGTFTFENSGSTDAIAFTDVGNYCYAADDQTVAKTSASGTRPVAGVIVGVTSTGKIRVRVGAPGRNLLATANRESLTFQTTADSAANTTTAETIVARTPYACTITGVTVSPTGAITASDTVYATITIKQGDGEGGARATVATIITNVAGGNWVAFDSFSGGAVTNPTLAAGSIITITIAKASTGTQLPSCLYTLTTVAL